MSHRIGFVFSSCLKGDRTHGNISILLFFLLDQTSVIDLCIQVSCPIQLLVRLCFINWYFISLHSWQIVVGYRRILSGQGGMVSGMHYFLSPFISTLLHCLASSHHFEAGKNFFHLSEAESAGQGVASYGKLKFP